MSDAVSEQPNTEHVGNSEATGRFVFIPLTSGEVAVGGEPSKQVVRAHVTRLLHARSTTRHPMQNMQPWTVRPYTPRTGVPALSKAKSRLKTPAAIARNDAKGKANPPPAAATAGQLRSSTSTPLYLNGNVALEEYSIESVPRFLGGAQMEDPFWTYPVDYEDSLSPIFAHYIENIAVDNPDLDGAGQKSLVRRQWFPLAMTEPAAMYAVLLMAAAHYCIVAPSHVRKPDLLHLKARALAEINTALRETSRAVSDATIGGVMKMAAYEAIFGDSSIYAAHMQGLAVMLRMRGGLSQLGLNGLLERMLVWIDLNASYVTGLSRTMGGEDLPTAVEFSGPDPCNFTAMS